MKIRKGKEGKHLTWQDEFPETAKCSCGGTARMAFTAREEDEEFYICNLYENDGKGGYWPHDAIAVAVYFCRECFKPITFWNQA